MHKIGDAQERERQRSLLALQTLREQALAASKILSAHLTEKELLKVLNMLEDLEAWIQVNSDKPRLVLDRKRRQMDSKFDSLFAPAYAVHRQLTVKAESNSNAEGDEFGRKRTHEEMSTR